ncbi:MAG: glycosyltransferase family 4 protein [Planctomycetota bacterium]
MTAQRLLRVGLWAPAIPPSTRGNAVTLARLVRQLRARGAECHVADFQRLAADLEGAQRHAFDVLHCFHLLRAYDAIVARGGWHDLGRPLVLTQTGTDLLDDGVARPDFAEFLAAAAHILVGTEHAREHLRTRYPQLDPARVSVAWKGVDLPREPVDLPEDLRTAPGEHRLVLLPAHWRPVKGIELALDAWRQVAPLAPDARLWLLGGILDSEYASRLAVDSTPGAWRRELPRAAMVAAYRTASLVLNVSLAESLPNALLEALYLGRPVLAPDIPGVRAILRCAEPGLASLGSDECPLNLFDRAAGAKHLAERIVDLIGNADRLTRQSRVATKHFSHLSQLEREGEQVAAIYRDAVNRGVVEAG